jgi:hypothetical protein
MVTFVSPAFRWMFPEKTIAGARLISKSTADSKRVRDNAFIVV